ncbi:MAG: alpha-L-rhamnosidase N-terminal domain-containing protein, partial [Acidobacteria bacterium]|nr:alpha-L-rhamnosidase N-terminal domain-containing protein [Acidobacteriota bacterium]
MKLYAPLLVASALLLSAAQLLHAAGVLQNLTVEYRRTPLGIDVATPRFAWQMAATAGERGLAQSAYQLTVRDPRGDTAWDSGRIESSLAAAIPYAGKPLASATRYTWSVTVWDLKGAKLTASSWFETGLMDPSPDAPAWDGAKWIGGGGEDLVLYAPYLSIFDVSYAIAIAPGSSRASFVYAANDPRLMDRNKNIYQLQNAKDQSYIKLELDVAPLAAAPAGKAKLNVYRVGYQKSDSATTPFRTFEIGADILNAANRNAEHTVYLRSAFGLITVTIDGKSSLAAVGVPAPAPGPGGGGGAFGRTAPSGVNLNPAGSGGNYIAYGLLCDIGFSLDPGQNATFRNVQVRNNRAPNNVLFQENLAAAPYQGIYAKAGLPIRDGRFSLSGGAAGLFVVRDPSRNGNPLLRAAFKAAAKPIAQARLYVTARGIYEVYLNGKRIGDDYYNPGLTQYNITHLYQTYDVTPMVAAGPNALCAMLGEGWWSGLLSFGTIWNHFGDRQSLLAKLVITYKDGTADTLVTGDPAWKFSNHGPLVYGSLDNGEVYDATREAAVAGWTSAAYNDSKWKPASVVPLQGTTFSGSEPSRFGPPMPPFSFDRLRLVGQIGENAGVFKVLTAKSMKQPRPGVYVYDIGQN